MFPHPDRRTEFVFLGQDSEVRLEAHLKANREASPEFRSGLAKIDECGDSTEREDSSEVEDDDRVWEEMGDLADLGHPLQA